jgi:hypothetical protein
LRVSQVRGCCSLPGFQPDHCSWNDWGVNRFSMNFWAQDLDEKRSTFIGEKLVEFLLPCPLTS